MTRTPSVAELEDIIRAYGKLGVKQRALQAIWPSLSKLDLDTLIAVSGKITTVADPTPGFTLYKISD